MNRFADQSVDRPIVERLRQDSHDAVYVAELAPSITDDEVLREANRRSAVLVTADKDFTDPVGQGYAQGKREFRDGPCLVKVEAKRDEYKEEVKCDR